MTTNDLTPREREAFKLIRESKDPAETMAFFADMICRALAGEDPRSALAEWKEKRPC